MSTLEHYLKRTGTTQDQFARLVGTTQATISRLTQGSRPSLRLAVAIERETGGAVPASSWVTADTPEPERGAA